jgi:hypothetical protein
VGVYGNKLPPKRNDSIALSEGGGHLHLLASIFVLMDKLKKKRWIMLTIEIALYFVIAVSTALIIILY